MPLSLFSVLILPVVYFLSNSAIMLSNCKVLEKLPRVFVRVTYATT